MEFFRISENAKYLKQRFKGHYAYVEIYIKEYFYKMLLFLILFYIRYIHSIKAKIEVDADNIFNTTTYENNTDFTKYLNFMKVKTIALYHPIFQIVNSESNYINEWENIKSAEPLYTGHHQPRIPDTNEFDLGYYDTSDPKVIKKQVKLAKSHGIYGFGIYYYWFSGKILFQKAINIFLENQDIDFPFFLIWKNENLEIKGNKFTEGITIEQEYKENDYENFIIDIKKYLVSKKYIKIQGKPLVGIFNPFDFYNTKNILRRMRDKAKEIQIGEIFLLATLIKPQTNDIYFYDAAYEMPPKHFFKYKLMQYRNYFYYSGLIYRRKNGFINRRDDEFPVFKCNMIEFDNSPIDNKSLIFDEYSPEKFYKASKLIVDWTTKNFDESRRIIFINGWNDWGEGTYLEPDKNFGFASINALSKALFDLPFHSKYDLTNLKIKCLVAVHAHIFYTDILNEIINKTNNIPIKFDLYLSTNTKEKMIFIKNYTDIFSKANNVSIKVTENRGRDILPFLIQMKEVIDKYKYLCHLHSKKTLYSPKTGEKWRIYLFNNLLGTTEVISEIISEFEKYDKLGLIFPENYYMILRFTMKVKPKIKERMNYLFTKIFPGYKFSDNYFDFPAGDMFWARTKAIYQIFKIDLRNDIPEEKGSKDILWAIERLWLFFVIKNGYYYKKYFNYYE